CTVAPACTFISFSTPATGAGTSSTTLSVSRSARFSSRATASPGSLCQFTSVASATDSGNFGTLISVLMGWEMPSGNGGTLAQHRQNAGVADQARRGAGPDCLALGGTQRRIDQLALLGVVDLGDAGGRRGRMLPAGVQQGLLALLQGAFEPVADLVPRALVLRLFLAPDDLARLRVAPQRGFIRLHRERIQLLDAHD